VLLRAVYSQAQGCCVCTVLQLGGDVEERWLMSKYDVIRKTGRKLGQSSDVLCLLSIGVVSGGAWGLAPPQKNLDHGQYFALILFKLHDIW